jgi:hypothetical protein
MAFSSIMQWAALQTLGFASISGTYAKLGTPIPNTARLVAITNNTDGDMLVSTDGTTNNIFIPASSSRIYDITANTGGSTNGSPIRIPKSTQFWIKDSTAPSKGAVWLEVLHGQGE